MYFSNASSLPPRLPFLSSILKAAVARRSGGDNTSFNLVALSYRGFWRSKGRPSQAGIELDVESALHWMFDKYQDPNTSIVVWGQSIGSGAASVGLANLLDSVQARSTLSKVIGLLLETPFVDTRSMLVALYPQKFLPYRYLAPFLRSTWDSKNALDKIANAKTGLRVLILQAGEDEIVPKEQAPILEDVCRSKDLNVELRVIAGALHTEVMMKGQGRSAIAGFLASF